MRIYELKTQVSYDDGLIHFKFLNPCNELNMFIVN